MSHTSIPQNISTIPSITSIQVHTYTGLQLTSALEKHYKALSSQINTIKLHNNKLSNHLLIKNTALNALTFGEYKRLFTHQKTLNSNPVEQEKTRQAIRAIENKYTTPPHTIELSRELKALEANFSVLIECNNNTLAALDKTIAITLVEKRKLTGRTNESFKTLSDKIIDLPTDALYQSQFMSVKQERKMTIIELAELKVKKQIQLSITSKDEEMLHGPRTVGESITTDNNGFELHLEYVARGINSVKETRFHWEREGLESAAWDFKDNWYSPQDIEKWARTIAKEEGVPEDKSPFTWMIETAEPIEQPIATPPAPGVSHAR